MYREQTRGYWSVAGAITTLIHAIHSLITPARHVKHWTNLINLLWSHSRPFEQSVSMRQPPKSALYQSTTPGISQGGYTFLDVQGAALLDKHLHVLDRSIQCTQSSRTISGYMRRTYQWTTWMPLVQHTFLVQNVVSFLMVTTRNIYRVGHVKWSQLQFCW